MMLLRTHKEPERVLGPGVPESCYESKNRQRSAPRISLVG